MPMTPRQAMKLIVECGGVFWRHGARHDLYRFNGKVIAVPRHAKDLTPGVERDVLRKLGL